MPGYRGVNYDLAAKGELATEGAMSEITNLENSTIRRAPSMDVSLAGAVRRLHELGPRLVLELEAEIAQLQAQLGQLRETAGHPPGKGAELVELLKG